MRESYVHWRSVVSWDQLIATADPPTIRRTTREVPPVSCQHPWSIRIRVVNPAESIGDHHDAL